MDAAGRARGTTGAGGRLARASLAAVLALLAAGLTQAAAANDPPAQVRFAYLAPASGNADLYWDSTRALANVAYKTVTPYQGVPAGQHLFEVRPAGAATAADMTQAQVTLAAADNYTILVGGRPGAVQATVVPDGFTTPPTGQAEVRFIHTAPDVPGVDVAVQGGPVLFSGISFLQASPYSPVPAGTYALQLQQAGTGQVLFTAAGVVAPAGTVHSLVAVGGIGQPIELVRLADAAGAGVAPIGGADTGGGGAQGAPAGRRTLPPGLALAGLALVLLTAAAVGAWVSRQTGRGGLT